MEEKETLRDVLHHINLTGIGRDIYIDAVEDGCAICAPVCLTDAGMKKWGKLLDMEMSGRFIMGTDKDYDDFDKYELDGRGKGGRLVLAQEFLWSLAGYCPDKDFKKWFEDGEEI